MLELGDQRAELFSDCIGVFQGGGCRAAAYAGAFRASRECGVHFSELAGTSAGSIAAALIAAGASAEWLERKLSSLDFKSLLRAPTGARLSTVLPRKLAIASGLLRHDGMHSSVGIEIWVEECLRELLPGATRPFILFKDLVKPLTVVATDIDTARAKLWSSRSTPDDRVASAVRASCSIPFFFQPVGKLVDGGLVSNLPLHAVPPDLYDGRSVLAFTLENDVTPSSHEGLLGLATALVTAATNGAQRIQQDLQRSVATVTINTGSVTATDFDKMSHEVVSSLIRSGHQATRDFLDGQSVNANPTGLNFRTTHEAETLSTLAHEILLSQREILISHRNTMWVFELYTAILLARMNGVKVRILLPGYVGNVETYTYQRELLLALGCDVAFTSGEQPPEFDAFIFDPDDDRRVAIISSSGGIIDSTILRARAGDDAVIDLISEHIRLLLGEAREGTDNPIGFETVSEEELRKILVKVDQYASGATIELRPIAIEAIDSWARYAHTYKQRQAERMAVKLRAAGLRPFEPFRVRYGNGSGSIALPPVVECVGPRRYVVVNGVSRLLHLYREGQQEALCAVVRSVQAPPPARGVQKVSDLPVMIGRRGEPSHRFHDFSQANLRSVERAAHTLELLRSSRAK